MPTPSITTEPGPRLAAREGTTENTEGARQETDARALTEGAAPNAPLLGKTGFTL
jgi:hypothetical protein